MKPALIRPAMSADRKRILALLTEAMLPTVGVEDHLQDYLVAEIERDVVGAIGLEVYGKTALLRSAVVQAGIRAKGIGSRLVEEVITVARGKGVMSLVLLTNTAEEYFYRKGFRKIDRESIRGPVTSSVEFTDACPSHAACMTLDLKPHVLIVCTGNSCRSQMAEGWLRNFGEGAITASSAGTHPTFVHPLAIAVMQESGVDITSHTSKPIDAFRDSHLDYVVTVCDNAKGACPSLPGKHSRVHIPFDDPAQFLGTKEEQLHEFRRVRDAIRDSMKQLASEIIR